MSTNNGTTESSTAQTGGRDEGVPCRCWCGEKIDLKLSKSQNNPNRKYFRCALAAAKRLEDNKHVFRWMDEAVVSEIHILNSKIESLHQELITSRQEVERIYREFESGILDRVEEVLMDGKNWFKKMVTILVLGFVIGCAIIKIIA